MNDEKAAREYVRRVRDETGPAHDPHSLLVGYLAGAAAEREAIRLAVLRRVHHFAPDQSPTASQLGYNLACTSIADAIACGEGGGP